ncbi:pimeloyl-ACP methyl ester carboxylesterase [Arthrobacter sp. SLBN-53]|nr:pimeloyl-ACP methyl ester carboxylesterase [Arthrobacter sp. SLBN-53]
MSLDAWWEQGRQLRVRVDADRDHQIFVRDGGDGPPLLLLHGFPASSYEWASMWTSLTGQHRVIAPDFLGFGASDKPRGHRYKVTEQADLIQELLARLNVSKPAVFCYDYGAIVTQELQARGYPLGHVTFSNAGVFPELYRPRPVQRLAVAPVVGPLLGIAAANLPTFTRTWGEVFSSEHPLQPDVAAEHFRAARSGAPGRTLQSRLLAYIPERAAMARRLEDALAANIHRSSFLWGLQDPVSGQAIAGELRRRFPEADLVTYPDVGHCPHLEVPNRVAGDLLARTTSSGMT